MQTACPSRPLSQAESERVEALFALVPESLLPDAPGEAADPDGVDSDTPNLVEATVDPSASLTPGSSRSSQEAAPRAAMISADVAAPQPETLNQAAITSKEKSASDMSLDERVQSRMEEWRAGLLKNSKLAPIYVAKEADMRKQFQDEERAKAGEPVYSDSTDVLIADADANPAIPIIEKLLYRGDRVVIHGYEETMKSLVILSLADAIANAKPWLGELRTGEPLRVGIVETEMRNPGLGERLKKMYPSGQGPRNLVFLSREKLKQFRRATTTEGRLEIIKSWAEFEKLDVVLVDVISDVFTGKRKPTDETDVSFVFDQLEMIQGVRLWVLVRHDSKPSKDGDEGNSNNRIRGSSEWKENPETVIHLTKDGRAKGVLLTVGKLRYGRKPVPFLLRYDAVAGTVVPGNPVLWLLAQRPMTREELIAECKRRYFVAETTVDKWIREIKSHLAEEQKGHAKQYSRIDGPSAEFIWRFEDGQE
jgi:hypothetical protein